MQNTRSIKLGPKQQLTRVRAVEEYIVFRIRAEEIARLDFMFQGFKSNRLTVPDGRFSAEDLTDTLRTALLGWFASLIDKDWRAIYAFNCLYHLFPNREDQIRSCQQKMEACGDELRLFRNNVAFHASKVISEHIRSRKALREDAFNEFVSAFREFRDLRNAVEEEELNRIAELPDVLRQFGLAQVPAFRRLMAKVANRPSMPRQFSPDTNRGKCYFEPDSCQMLDQ